ncbi:MAG: hypothetical protein ACFB51_06755 [Anaerolineae bacterium]
MIDNNRTVSMVFIGAAAIGVLIMCAGVALIIFFVSGSGSGPVASPTERAANSTLEARANWPVSFQSEFDGSPEEDAMWAFGEFENRFGQSMAEPVDGVLRLSASATEAVIWWQEPDFTAGDSFVLEVTADQVTGSANSAFGLMFWRADDANQYVFLVSETGFAFCYSYINESWTELYRADHFGLITTDPMRLTVSASPDQADLFVNGEYITTITGNATGGDMVAVAANMDTPDSEAVFIFDAFVVYEP